MTITAQEIFDIAARAVIEQGAPSMSDDCMTCAYRGAEGRKCAVGHLVTDEEAAQLKECWGIADQKMDQIPERLRDHITLMSGIQSAHDDAAFEMASPGHFVELFQRRMRSVAEECGLNADALDQP